MNANWDMPRLTLLSTTTGAWNTSVEVTMGKLLTNAERKRYHRDGFFFPITVMSAEDALAYRRELEVAEARFGPMHYLTKPYLLLSFADRLVHHPPILDAVEDL